MSTPHEYQIEFPFVEEVEESNLYPFKVWEYEPAHNSPVAKAIGMYESQIPEDYREKSTSWEMVKAMMDGMSD
jgi:hypothetical protein